MGHCGCSYEAGQTHYDLGCIDCGTACCPTCAVFLESATYCRSCARSLLGAGTVQTAGAFELQ